MCRLLYDRIKPNQLHYSYSEILVNNGPLYCTAHTPRTYTVIMALSHSFSVLGPNHRVLLLKSNVHDLGWNSSCMLFKIRFVKFNEYLVTVCFMLYVVQ